MGLKEQDSCGFNVVIRILVNFFHNSIRFCNHHNSISLISNYNGNCLTDRQDGKKVFL